MGNFGVNKGILIAGMVIALVTILNQIWVHSTEKNVTKILVGTYIFILILAFVDMIPGASQVTTAMSWLAALTVILLYGGGILGKVNQLTGTVPTSSQAASSEGTSHNNQ